MHHPTLRHLRSNAVAYLALFVALGGTSFAAATVITGKDVKNSSLTGKDVKNSSLTGGDVKNKSLSPKDFNGSVEGPQGDTGPQGVPGAKGNTGEPGPFPDVLPTGKTLTGPYGYWETATAADQNFVVPISFGFRFSSAPTVVTVVPADTAQERAAAGCPGTLDNPQAAPGKLCIYEFYGNNADVLQPMSSPGGHDVHVATLNLETESRIATKFGFILNVQSAAAGSLDGAGKWAATSP